MYIMVYISTLRQHQMHTLTRRDGDLKAMDQIAGFLKHGTEGVLALHSANYYSDRYGSSSHPLRRLERQVLDSKWRLMASARTVKHHV